MPRGDRTGPAGEGPRTGRKKGRCSGNSEPGYKDSGRGVGINRKNGRGAGRRSGVSENNRKGGNNASR